MEPSQDHAPVDPDAIVPMALAELHQDGSQATPKSLPVSRANHPSTDPLYALDPTTSPADQQDQQPKQWQQDVSKPHLESIGLRRKHRLH
jgi:hypothetical protein